MKPKWFQSSTPGAVSAACATSKMVMCMVNKGDRVFVESFYFKGWATVFEIFPGEMFSIQVELDEPDEDGHRMKRVEPDEIKRLEGESE